MELGAFWIAVLVVGVSQGAFLALSLAVKRTASRHATRTLAVLVGVIALGLLLELIGTVVPSLTRELGLVNVSTELACGPLVFLFMTYLVGHERRFRRTDLLHFLPLAASLAGWLSLLLVLRLGLLALDPPRLRTAIGVFLVAKAAYFYVYLGLAYRQLSRGLERARGFAAGRRSVELGWLKRWTLALGGLATLIYLAAFLGMAGVRIFRQSDRVSALVLAVLVYLIASMVLFRPWTLSARPRPPADSSPYAEDMRQLERYLEREQPYLEPDLTLTAVARALGFSENRLSAAINEGLGTTFYALVNRHRLRHFEQLAAAASYRDRTVLELAFAAGFNSKASFYRAFRDAHGTTPTAYRKQLLG